MGKEAEEVYPTTSGEVNPRECWFNMETMPVERHALFRLEREMDATLMFQQDRGHKVS